MPTKKKTECHLALSFELRNSLGKGEFRVFPPNFGYKFAIIFKLMHS